jgi:hypothetical protein
MSFADSEAVAGAERRRLEPSDDEHHPFCPQNPDSEVFEETRECECDELRLSDDAEAADQARKRGLEG